MNNLKNQKGAIPSFLVVVTSFLLGIFFAGLVVFAYTGFQGLLTSYQAKLDKSGESLETLSAQTREMLYQMNLALEENQKKIEELEQIKAELSQKRVVEQPKTVEGGKEVKKNSPSALKVPDPIDKEIQELTRYGIPEDSVRCTRLIELYKKKAEKNPSDPEALIMVGQLSQKLGDYGQATRYLEQALEKGGELQDVVGRLAQIYDEWKMPEKAE
ncbi:MAG: hypothetical protein Q7S00_05760, partial [bacterium]|nr:hypothetical protein [bacterium]